VSFFYRWRAHYFEPMCVAGAARDCWWITCRAQSYAFSDCYGDITGVGYRIYAAAQMEHGVAWRAFICMGSCFGCAYCASWADICFPSTMGTTFFGITTIRSIECASYTLWES